MSIFGNLLALNVSLKWKKRVEDASWTTWFRKTVQCQLCYKKDKFYASASGHNTEKWLYFHHDDVFPTSDITGKKWFRIFLPHFFFDEIVDGMAWKAIETATSS